MQFIVLEDSNGHQAPFKLDDFMAKLVENQEGLFGCDLAVLLTLKQGAQGIGIPLDQQGVQGWFENLAKLIEAIREAGVELTPEAITAALAVPAPVKK